MVDHEKVECDVVGAQEIQEADDCALLKEMRVKVRIAFKLCFKTLTIPTGPNPTTATINTLSYSSNSSHLNPSPKFRLKPTPPPGTSTSISGELPGNPTRRANGDTFGCCTVCSAAKHPVARMSARRRREVLDIVCH